MCFSIKSTCLFHIKLVSRKPDDGEICWCLGCCWCTTENRLGCLIITVLRIILWIPLIVLFAVCYVDANTKEYETLKYYGTRSYLDPDNNVECEKEFCPFVKFLVPSGLYVRTR